jgi:hypothetical protein
VTVPSPRGHDLPCWDAGGWRRRAACRGMGADLFFPAGERDDAAVARTAAAKQVCAAHHHKAEQHEEPRDQCMTAPEKRIHHMAAVKLANR